VEPSAPPGPAFVKIVVAQRIRAGDQPCVGLDQAGIPVFDGAHCIEKRNCHLGLARHRAECAAEGSCARYLRSRFDQQRREAHLIVVHENRTVLEEDIVGPPLCATNELASFEGDFADRGMVKAGKDSGLLQAGVPRARVLDHSGSNSESPQGGDQETIDARVGFAQVPGISHRPDDRIRHLAIVQDSAPTCRPTDHVDALIDDSREIVGPGRPLIASQRERRRVPCIDATDPGVGLRREQHQGLVHGHVGSAGRGR